MHSWLTKHLKKKSGTLKDIDIKDIFILYIGIKNDKALSPNSHLIKVCV